MDYAKFIFCVAATFTYIKLWFLDTIDYYIKYLILSMPTYMFDQPIIRIRQLKPIDLNYDPEDSDDESNLTLVDYDLFISQVIFIFKTNDTPPLMKQRRMHGLQLRPFIEPNGRLFVGAFEKYYSNLDTIMISYIKIPTIDSTNKSSELDKQTKVIDVKSRKDIRSGKSCRFGAMF